MIRNVRVWRKIGLCGVLASALACGHGPPEGTVSIGDYGSPPGGEMTIALRKFEIGRRARGLSAFPDGGMGISVDAGVEINVCRKATGRFEQVAIVHEGGDGQSFSTPQISAWLDTAVRISKVTGGDTIVRLPPTIRVGSELRNHFERVVISECETALRELRLSQIMPDGTPAIQ